MTYNNIALSGGTNISYISAGAPTLPPLLLLHGFPSSSNQYRNLLPLLSETYHTIAPNFPGFGLTTVPSLYNFTFDNLAQTTAAFLLALNITSYTVYMFDCGAPVALRLALAKPESIKAIITQNGNAYNEGFGHPFWDPIEALWASKNSSSAREVLRTGNLTLATTAYQYTASVPTEDLPLINAAACTYDLLQNVATPEDQEHELDLFYDYRNNKGMYPKFHEYFQESQVPLLAV